MPAHPVQEFVDNEAGYLSWLKAHSEGLVLNAARTRAPSYMVLHRATCPLIGQYSRDTRPGSFTRREYIKICALDVESLRAWARWHGRPDGTFTSQCAVCRPRT